MAVELNETTIEELKARTDLSDLIASYGISLRRSGSGVMACCPFHNEKTPSFHINTSKGFYHCFGCGESGDAIKFVQKYEGLSFMDAVKKLAGMCGMEIKSREKDPEAGRSKRLFALMADLAAFYHRCLLKTKEAAIAREYLERRRLGPEAQEDFIIGYAPAGSAIVMKWAEKHGYTPEEMEAAGVVKFPGRPGGSFYHRFSGRLMFTVRDRQGRVVAFSGRQLVEDRRSGKYVNSPETLIFKKGRVLFGFDKAASNIVRSPHREVICCEGQIDTIRLHTSGFNTAVASQGTAFTEDHAKMIRRVADSAVLMYDDDAAGHKATVKVASMLLAMEMPVRVVSLPDGDDPDSFLLKHPPEDLASRIASAESIVSFQCRMERAKERDPGSIDAVMRVTRAVLETIASCPGAVLRSSMVDEASRILSIPTAALMEDLGKVKSAKAAARPTQEENPAQDEEDSPVDEDTVQQAEDPAGAEQPDVVGVSAASAEPPPDREFAFMGFLMANEADPDIAGMVVAHFTPAMFASDFTRRFIGLWLDEARDGGDPFAAFQEGLCEMERKWFDRILSSSYRSDASGLGRAEILRDFARSLWCDRLRRERGLLPAAGDEAAATRRIEISMDLKRLQQSGWDDAARLIEGMISSMKKGEKDK